MARRLLGRSGVRANAVAATRPLDAVLLLGAALVVGGLAPGGPWEVAVAVTVIAAAARMAQRASRSLVLLTFVVASIGAARGGCAVTRHEQERALAWHVLGLPERCTARAIVVSSPVRVHDVLRYDAALDGVACGGEARSEWRGVATLYGGPGDLARGDQLDVVATLGEPQRLWNLATGDPRPAEAHRGVLRSGGTLDVRVVRRAAGVRPWIDRLRGRVRRRIDASFAPDLAPMARALVLGESDLAADDDRAFRASGLSHLLAVSGMHLVLVLAAVVRLLEGLLVRVEILAARMDVGRIAAAVGLPAAWIYSEFAGAGGSTVRAAWMATAVLMARLLGRRTDAPRAFGVSLMAMAVVDPLVAYDLSFMLSAAATAGLLVFARPFGETLARLVHPRLAPVARAAATTLAASVPCAPILARFAPTVPVGGVIANLLAVPVGECAALPLCLAHALLAWWPAAERGCAGVASGALVLVRLVARGFATPALTASIPQPTSWQIVAMASGASAIALRVPRRAPIALVAAMLILVLETVVRRDGAPRGILRATFLDVGQGDAAIVDLPDGEAMVIDGGGLVGSPIDVGVRVLAPELRARRRRALAAVVLTHPHPDHFSGLVTGLDGTDVRALWDTGEGEAEGTGGGYALLLARTRARGIAVLRPGELCGERSLGGARIEVLAPCPDQSPDRGPNDNSFVLRISYGSRAFLFVGDAEEEEEAGLLATAKGRLHADVLKVGHHGSRTSSTPAFIAAVRPREAVISVGGRNRFGHPSPVTLRTLAAAGARTWRTDLDGAVVASTDGRSLEVRAAGVDEPDGPL